MNEMNAKMSFKTRVKFAASVSMGEDFLELQHVFICRSAESKLQVMLR